MSDQTGQIISAIASMWKAIESIERKVQAIESTSIADIRVQETEPERPRNRTIWYDTSTEPATRRIYFKNEVEEGWRL